MVKIPLDKPDLFNTCDLIEMLFSNKKRCGADTFKTTIFRDPYMIIVYADDEECARVAARDYQVNGKKLMVTKIDLLLKFTNNLKD